MRQRTPLSFAMVNRKGQPGHMPGMQRHHILPRQLLTLGQFETLIEEAGGARVIMGDFRTNGLLLPASEKAASRYGLPLHRGPHPHYNEIVSERVAAVESHWHVARKRCASRAASDALCRLHLLQGALRRRLLHESRPLVLNRRDPLGKGQDFSALDAMADALWAATAPVAV